MEMKRLNKRNIESVLIGWTPELIDSVGHMIDSLNGKTATYLDYDIDHKEINIWYHNTAVAVLKKTHIELYTGGWYTMTTKSRMNTVLSILFDSRLAISQNKGKWFINAIPYSDNISIGYDGVVL